MTQKRDAARQLVIPAMEDQANPLSVIPDVAVQELLFTDAEPDGSVRAIGVPPGHERALDRDREHDR